MNRPLSFLAFAFFFALAFSVAHRARPRDAFSRICVLTRDNFYRSDPEVSAWIDRCRRAADRWPAGASVDRLLETVQELLDELHVSHFVVFGPAADRRLWRGEAVHTGIHARYVDGHLVVYRIIPGSAAAALDLRPGDEILRLPGVAEVSPAGAARRAGVYHLARRGRGFEVTVRPGPVREDGAMTVTTLAGGARLLTIPSFRAEFFGAAEVRRVAARLLGATRVVVDVRENAGGNYAALLRALSLFVAPGTLVGTLVQPRRTGEPGDLGDVIDDAEQYARLERHARLTLRVPPGYPRFEGLVTVLTDNDSASAAEVFAAAMKGRPGARVMGWPTAGRVVLAMWYDVPELGPDFSLAVPRAAFIDARGETLEGVGVRPDRELYHDLATSLRGEDAWINAAVR